MKRMKRFIPAALSNRKGFTLVEMLAVLALVIVVAGLAISYMGNTSANAADRADASQITDGARQVAEGMNAFKLNNSNTNATLATVVSSGTMTTLPPAPVSLGGSAWTLDTTTASGKTLLSLAIPTAQLEICKNINTKFVGTATPASAYDATKDFQCVGTGPYTFFKLVY